MNKIDTVFKAYDIRGRTPDELDPELAHQVGRALADFLPAGTVAVGRDMRTDSDELASAVERGLVEQGRAVLDLGQCTSDLIYFAIGNLGLAGGAIVTASHNAAGYNGIKLTGAGVVPIGAGGGLDKIKAAILTRRFYAPAHGGQVQKTDLTTEFVEHAVALAERDFGKISDLKIALDAGNGMAGIVVKDLAENTPLQITGLFLEPDGSFPNHPANPMIEQNISSLKNAVTNQHLNAGVAFDGDGDRAFLIDEQAAPISASILGALLAEQTLKKKPGAAIVYSKVCSEIVPDTIKKFGGKPVPSRAGHSFIKAKMHEVNAALAIEHSGHFYFTENWGADSGLIAALCALAVLSNFGKKLSELVAPFHVYSNSGELNFTVESPSDIINRLKSSCSSGKIDESDGLTVRFADWWFSLRSSNTEPVLRLNIEANNAQILAQKIESLTSFIEVISKKP